jgi:hypothetical protein
MFNVMFWDRAIFYNGSHLHTFPFSTIVEQGLKLASTTSPNFNPLFFPKPNLVVSINGGLKLAITTSSN